MYKSTGDRHHEHSSAKKLRDLVQRLYCPESRVNEVETKAESSLSHVPWTVQLDEENSTCDTAAATTAPPSSAESRTAPFADSKPAPTKTSFLPVFYLELRRQQNIAFADTKASEASLLQHDQAETLFKQAMDLVPDHVPSLLGYGKLLYKKGRLLQAQRMLQDVLEVEPDNTTALQCQKSIEQTIQQRQLQQQQQFERNDNPAVGSTLTSGKKRKELQMRKSSAFQDALLERNLARHDTTANDGHVVDNEKDREVDNSDSYDSDEDDRRRRRRRQHKKDRKRKKKKKRRKEERRKRYDSSSSGSSISALPP